MTNENINTMDMTPIIISTHNVLVNNRKTEEKDIEKFLSRRKAILKAMEDKQEIKK